MRKKMFRALQRHVSDSRTLIDSFFRLDRNFVAGVYIRGSGIEIGALHNPLRIPGIARVRYLDRLTREELVQHYPELGSETIRPVDIVDDGEKLTSVPGGSQDFLIAGHFLEHSEDPIGTLKNMLRVLKTGGILFLAIPDKRYTFDRDRTVTILEHLVRDHEEGPGGSRREHYEDWVHHVSKIADPSAAAREVDRLLSMKYRIHFHLWTQAELMELSLYMRKETGGIFDVELFLKNGEEVILVARKNAPPAGTPP